MMSIKGQSRRLAPRLGIIVALLIVAVAAVMIASLYSTSSSVSQPARTSAKASPSEKSSTPTPSQTPTPKIDPVTFTVAATGDVLPHKGVVRASRQGDGTYDFEPLLHNLTPYISGADFSIFHAEVPFGLNDDHIAGYPVFAAPRSWVNSVKAMGYDAVSLASNHTWDQGLAGIETTIKLYEEHGFGTTGASYRPDEGPIQYYTLTRNGRDITIAHLSLTYGLNPGIVPELAKNPWMTNVDNVEEIVELAKKARSEGHADVVIVSGHAGWEYKTEPTKLQVRWTKALAESKTVDLYIGHHVHVAQPIQTLEGGPDGRGMPVFYGTGNLLATMGPQFGIGTQTGMIAHATITVPSEGPAHVDSIGWTPLVFDINSHQVFPVHAYDRARYPGSGLPNSTATTYYNHVKSIVGNDVLEVNEPGTPGGDPPVALKR
ncbi:MAG: CapA family protein [Actinomycetaceae bacterium]|nr:CapA family protein [Actinomycetaceae bacterium]